MPPVATVDFDTVYGVALGFSRRNFWKPSVMDFWLVMSACSLAFSPKSFTVTSADTGDTAPRMARMANTMRVWFLSLERNAWSCCGLASAPGTMSGIGPTWPPWFHLSIATFCW